MALNRCVFVVFVGWCALMPASACSHAPAPVATTPATPAAPCANPEPLRLMLQATSAVNRGEKGEALAVVVRVYQLKNSGKLQGTGFDDILDRDKETLGDELTAVSEVTINPGERLEPPIVRNPDAVYLAIVALFRRPSGNTWRAIVRLPPPDPQHCHPTTGEKGSAAPDGLLRFVLDENRIDRR